MNLAPGLGLATRMGGLGSRGSGTDGVGISEVGATALLTE